MININTKNIFLTLILGILLFTHYVVKANPARLDKIVAVVNSGVITQSEVDKRVIMMKRQLGGDSSTSMPSASTLRQRALDDLIDISLQLQLAKRAGIQISDSELDEAVANIAKSHNLTLEKLKEVLPEQEGMSFVEFRRQFREQGLISRTQQRFLGSEVVISNKDIDAILRNPPKANSTPPQYHVIDILFEVADGAPKEQVDAIKNAARQMVVELQRGGDINDVVKEGQDNLKEQVIKSEDLGWRKVNELPELFAKDVAAMKVNQVVGPIQAPNGIHLLKLLAIQGSSLPSVKLTRDQAGEIAFRRKLNEKLDPWLKELRETAYIKIIK